MRQRNFIRLTLVVSILAGILLPLALGVKDLYSIALIFFNLVHLCSSSVCHDLSAQAQFENQGQSSEWCISRTV